MLRDVSDKFRAACASDNWVKNPYGLLFSGAMTGLAWVAFSRNYDPLFASLVAGLNFYLIRSSYLRGALKYSYRQKSDTAEEMARELQENEDMEFPSKETIQFRQHLEKVMPDAFKDTHNEMARNVEAAVILRMSEQPKYNWRKDAFHLGNVATLLAINLAILAGQINAYNKEIVAPLAQQAAPKMR